MTPNDKYPSGTVTVPLMPLLSRKQMSHQGRSIMRNVDMALVTDVLSPQQLPLTMASCRSRGSGVSGLTSITL
jgi:hypothetical protein